MPGSNILHKHEELEYVFSISDGVSILFDIFSSFLWSYVVIQFTAEVVSARQPRV